MLENIQGVINQYTQNVHTITDIFAGTGAVSKFFKDNGYSVFSNDLLYLSYVLNKGILEMNTPISNELRRLYSILITFLLETVLGLILKQHLYIRIILHMTSVTECIFNATMH